MPTSQFQINIGVNAGYFHDNAKGSPRVEVARLWQEIAERVYQKAGVFVAGVVQPALTVYRKEWGCPEGGEDTVTVTGLRNPEFQKDEAVWRQCVRDVALDLGKALDQTTVYLTFSEVDFIYIKPKEEQ